MGRALGWAVLIVSVLVIILYAWLVFAPPVPGLDILLLKLTGFAGVLAVFGTLAWLGYTIATTPPAKPVEEIEREIEEELRRLGEQEKEGSGG